MVEGHAVIVTGDDPPDEMYIRNAAEMEIFGLTEAIGQERFRYSLKAITACRVDLISKENFEAFLTTEKLPRARLTRILGIAIQIHQRLIHKC